MVGVRLRVRVTRALRTAEERVRVTVERVLGVSVKAATEDRVTTC